MPEERERTHRQTRRDGERSRCEIRRLFPPGFIHPSFSLSLPLYLSSSAPPRARSRVYVRDARGVTYPPGKPHSDIDSRHFAVPLAPDDTRKPNGKRKYDTDFRSMETNSGNSWQIAQDCSLSAGTRRPSPRDSTFIYTPPPPARNHIRMLETRRLVVITAESRLVVSTALFLLSRKMERISPIESPP